MADELIRKDLGLVRPDEVIVPLKTEPIPKDRGPLPPPAPVL